MKSKNRIVLLFTLSSFVITTGFSSAQTNHTWNGTDGDYLTPANWTPATAPSATDPVAISAGTATTTTELSRATETTLSGGILQVTGVNFLNATDAAATLTINSGELQHSGAFFVGASNLEGKIVQNGGTLTSTVTDGWYLSQNEGSNGTYELNGGTLNVIDNSTNIDEEIQIGIQANSDLFHLNGGTANFSAATTGRRFYVSRNATLKIDSGTLNADAFQYFIIGRQSATNTLSKMEVNGGDINLTNTTGALIVGAGNGGVLNFNGGTLHTNNGSMWLGDGSAAGTVNQTGGEIDLGTSNMTLSRQNSGTYQMSGGHLSLGSIVVGSGTYPQFALQGGEVVLTGDQRSIVDESWFYALAPVEATYDEASNTTTLSATKPTGKESTYRYYRFTTTRLRDRFSTAIQLSEFEFLHNGQLVNLNGVTVDNGGATTPDAEGPANVIDGDVTTKWYQGVNGPLVFDFGTATAIDGYRFVTANDYPDRDPQRWTLEGSSDGVTWNVIDRVISDYPMTTNRRVETLDIPLPTDVPEEPALTSLDWIGDKSSVWDDGLNNWFADSATAWVDEVDAIFGEQGTSKAITINGTVVPSLLEFNAAGYSISGGSFSLDSGIIDTHYDATINSVITGSAEIRKGGDGILELTGQNTFTGKTNVRSGTLLFTGSASSTGNGGLLMANETGAKTILEMNSTGSLTYSGSALIGNATDSVAIFHQTNGTVTSGTSGAYFTVGNGSNAYAEFRLDGGTFNASTSGPSGIRVGFGSSHGSLVQTGGTLNCPRYLAIGSATGTGMASFLSGNAIIGLSSNTYRLIVGDGSGSTATANLGTMAGGDATITHYSTDGLYVGSGSPGTFNLNSGTLSLGGPIRQGSYLGTVNLNGATIVAMSDGINIMNDTVDGVAVYKKGITIDTGANNVVISSDIGGFTGNGVYIEGGKLTVADGGSGYLGAPFVTIASTSGTGASAIATLSDGSVNELLFTCPGDGYNAGDVLTFTFQGGGTDTPAPEFTYTLTAADLQANAEGQFIKIGSGTLTTQAESLQDYPGDTLVKEGTFAANGLFGDSAIIVSPGATLTGNLDSYGPVVIEGEGTFNPGDSTGSAMSTASLTLEAGSEMGIDIADWDGTAGTSYDTTTFDSLVINATTSDKLTIRLDIAATTVPTESQQFVIATAANGISGLTADNWTIVENGPTASSNWSLSATATQLILTYTPGESTGDGYDDWVATYPGLADTDPSADPDGDGIANLLEYVLGTDPSQASSGVLPTVEETAEGLAFSFVRSTDAKDSTTQVLQTSTDLINWTDTEIPSATSGNVEITSDTPSAGYETVTVIISTEEAQSGKWFGRLSVTRD